ncbi:3-methyladenine DNA glycosylase [Mycobacterium koreense]|uniref:3-methyladenine DNA glycosylase n=1 Tax=Mycolicibacillus koreensis TaxID=1069220 RepID=A0A7I7S9J2_9MYCO|nr:3-methyladenine DNA glycosylase [Mycolicibacillus koreensis]MCV7246972.1 3-methyladenine DNA glycosylase [Mycolicibacillus koreensis]OSC35008.1 3-methyladenine DNA glycosylase [Mycolicibacillus koreensis]BBY53557.1 hypothetical protein MKOR_08080 [Mycolicibacillus koreensis]
MDTVLAVADWRERQHAHRARLLAVLGDYLTGRAGGRHDPVIDFLFTYYRLRPGRLLRWHPGHGVQLGAADANAPARRALDGYARLRGYRRTPAGAGVDPAFARRRRDTIAHLARLLAATAGRPPRLSCFGLHEWAMVYRATARQHPQVPLRLGRAGTDAVVEASELRCTHYDAFRFFTPAARPRNAAPLRRDSQIAHEQPGCLHAAMDLYRYCYQLEPLIPGELTAECFLLARTARVLDMRASPYDLSAYGYSAVPIETPAGRAQYVRAQTAIAEQAAPLRARVLGHCRELLETIR